jgi:uncharacterized protein (TIGR00369 family)
MTPQDADKILTSMFADWVLALQPSVTEIGQDYATLSIPITPKLARIGGIVSGQALSALADTSMVIACSAFMNGFEPIATTNLEVRFLRPATGDTVQCRARILKGGPSLLFAVAELIAFPSGKQVAQASATFFRP